MDAHQITEESIYSKYLKDALLSAASQNFRKEQEINVIGQLQFIKNELDEHISLLQTVKSSMVQISRQSDLGKRTTLSVRLKNELKENADDLILKLEQKCKQLPLTGIHLPRSKEDVKDLENLIKQISDGVEHIKRNNEIHIPVDKTAKYLENFEDLNKNLTAVENNIKRKLEDLDHIIRTERALEICSISDLDDEPFAMPSEML